MRGKTTLIIAISFLFFVPRCLSQCNPGIPPNVTVINYPQNVGQGSWFFWVCADSIYAGGGSNSFYLESGVIYHGGSGSNIIWVPPGSYVDIAGGGSNTIYYVCPESILHAGNGATFIKCPSIHYDYTYAPAIGCPHTSDTASCPAHIETHFTSSDTTFCDESGKCIDFTDQSTGNPTSWQWFFPGATPDTSTQQNPTNICYYNPGSYVVTLIASSGGVADTLSVSPLIVFGSGASLPVLYQSGDTLYCSHESAYQWYYNGSPIPGATDSFYVAFQPGNYSVFITDDVGCSRLSNGLLFAAITDIDIQALKLDVYPNPVSNVLTISFSSRKTEALFRSGKNEFVIKDAVGKEYLRKFAESLNGEMIIQTGSWSNGIYFLEVHSNEFLVLNRKFVMIK